MISSADIEYIEDSYDLEDLDVLEREIIANAVQSQTLKARQKLELYWESKRLQNNLYDVFADEATLEVNVIARTKFKRNVVSVNHNA